MPESYSPVGAARAPFALLSHFAWLSLVAFTVVTLLLASLFEGLARRDIVGVGEHNNVALASTLANTIWPAYAAFLPQASRLDGERLREHVHTRRLHARLVDLMAGAHVLKVKIYDLRGRTVFSTEAAQIGEDKSGNGGFLAARDGTPVSELTHRDSFSAFERTIENRDVLASYLPVRPAGPEGAVTAVFELYSDVTPLLADLARTRTQVVGGVVAILGTLYVFLYAVVRRANGVIRSQHASLATEISARERAEAQVRDYNARLEREVAERTAALQVALEGAQAASRAKSTFLANVSHELRTPLHGILGFARLGQDRHGVVPTEKLGGYFGQIRDSGNRLLSLVDELLDLARLEAGEVSLARDVLDPCTLGADTLAEFHAIAAERSLRLELCADPALPAIAGDEGKLRQVLRNLVANSARLAPAHSAIVVQVDSAPGSVRFRVVDEGPGIPPGEEAGIFEKFVQSSRTRSNAGGTGLGLSISREIVAAHGGRIWAEPDRAEGAALCVELPALAGDAGLARAS